MRLINTKDLKRLVEEGAMDFKDLFERDETAGPCREIKIDRERRRVVLLVDRRELISQTLEALGVQELSLEWINDIMALWREGRIEDLRWRLGLPPGGGQ
jgi:hypothetical protein